MKAEEIKKDIYWVGAKDWNIRNFHGYEVPKGTSYNAYLIKDEKITLVDTVKCNFADELLQRVSDVIDPEKIDYLICNHVEMDHSGSMPKVMEIAKNATIITDKQGSDNLQEHYDTTNWKIQVIAAGDTLNIGKKTLTFIPTPMLHWPDSMQTYIAEEKLLLSNDAFGQHIASDNIFANENPKDVIYHEAKKYYANILYPYGRQALKALENLKNLEIEMIAPSHGCIWQNKDVDEIRDLYNTWATDKNKNKAVVIYDTMWGSTEKLAQVIEKDLEELDIEVTMRSLKINHISDVITDVLDSKYIFIGSPTLNNQIMPNVAGFLNYMRGLKPHNKIGFTFGSYGWAIGALNEIQDNFKALKWDTPMEPYAVKYIPKGDFEKELSEKIKQLIKTTKD